MGSQSAEAGAPHGWRTGVISGGTRNFGRRKRRKRLEKTSTCLSAHPSHAGGHRFEACRSHHLFSRASACSNLRPNCSGGRFWAESSAFSPGFRLCLLKLFALLLDHSPHLIDELVDLLFHACRDHLAVIEGHPGIGVPHLALNIFWRRTRIQRHRRERPAEHLMRDVLETNRLGGRFQYTFEVVAVTHRRVPLRREYEGFRPAVAAPGFPFSEKRLDSRW